MCGIAGFQSDNIDNRQRLIISMLDTITHRGPDGQGAANIDNISLGHVRLAIIDIEHGAQPMQSPDKRYTIVFNGEIYNYFELRQILTRKGHKLKSHCDSEVLLHMYIEYGKEVVHHLNGMFAFAIYDNKQKTLFLARDHFGIKPLYYCNTKESFVFASEIKALLKFPGIKAEVNNRYLYEYLTFQMLLKDHSLFKGIGKLEPAHYLIVKDAKVIEKKEYWKLNYTIDTSKTAGEYADELLLLLENSLSLQMRSDVSIGVYLSGGLDSSIVATLASKNYASKLYTFTGGFKGIKGYDETGYARIVSKAIKSAYHEIFPLPNDFLDNFEKIIYYMDEPEGGFGIFPQFMVSRFASKYVKVVLGGQGGDEIFGGYARYAVAYLEQCLKGAIFETQEEGQHVVTLHAIIANMPLLQQYIPMIRNQFSQGLFDSMDKRYFKLVDRSPHLNLVYNREFLSARNHEELFSEFSEIFNKPDTKSYFNKMSYFDLKTLLPALLHIEDRVGMAASIESRVPLLDRRIVELAARMPPTMKFAGGKTKAMLLKAVENVIPRQIVERKDKMGFPTPLNEWFATSLKDFVLDTLLSSKARQRGILNAKNIEDLVAHNDTFSRDIWGALNIEMWFKTFID